MTWNRKLSTLVPELRSFSGVFTAGWSPKLAFSDWPETEAPISLKKGIGGVPMASSITGLASAGGT